MTETIVIIVCTLLLIAYLFDLTAARTRIPSVVLLLLLGWVAQQAVLLFNISLPGLSELLPLLGTLGLILIVLEGSLELELNASKFSMVKISLAGAVVSLVVLTGLLAAAFCFMGECSLKTALINAVPFGVISSAVAIPTARALNKQAREFVVYESSLSDIVGVLLFNFLAYNSAVTFFSVGFFGIELVLISIVSFVATLVLSYLLSKINHHIKFIPIILLVVLIYETSKLFHLPGLLFILFFGLFLGNLEELGHLKWMQVFRPELLKEEVKKFKELTVEVAFLVRSIFFLLFGFLLQTAEILNPETLVWALVIVASIFIVRGLQLKFFGYNLMPLLFIAPRGLITILLFLSIAPEQSIPLVNKSLVVQVVLLTALVMMFGVMMAKPSTEEASEQLH